MGCQSGSAISGRDPIASMQVIQNTIDCVVSVRPMIFTSTDESA